eukprot:8496510-Alexandrium_andersonii.AAC.1
MSGGFMGHCASKMLFGGAPSGSKWRSACCQRRWNSGPLMHHHFKARSTLSACYGVGLTGKSKPPLYPTYRSLKRFPNAFLPIPTSPTHSALTSPAPPPPLAIPVAEANNDCAHRNCTKLHHVCGGG